MRPLIMDYVIGSGPAGVACAQALLKRGASVQMLDAGLELEPERAQVVRDMSAVPPAAWSSAQMAVLKENTEVSSKGIVLKRLFGSDFPYRGADKHIRAEYHGVGLRPSLALGGLSNVWGAAILPYLDSDLDAWPFKSAALGEHYRAAVNITGLAARHDDLENLFPLNTTAPIPLQLGRQSRTLLENLERHRDELRRSGILFGGARLAVRATALPQADGCVYCGLCMYGCPYGYIYNSAETVRQMQTNKNFQYQSGVIVNGLREAGDRVEIEGYHANTQKKFRAEARRVYLAAGLIPTTKILLQSQSVYDRPVLAHDSQYFLFPLLQRKRSLNVRSEALNTLSQLFLEIQNPRISPRTIHLQIYSFNEFIGEALRQSLGPLKFLAPQIEDRMLIVQGFLHSDHSASIRLNFKKASRVLEVSAELNPETPHVIRKVLRLLVRHAAKLGALVLPPMLQVAEPGRSFHSGGSFPMRTQPGPLESDVLGRPHGWQRVHVVDASVFPSIPATAITLSVMANAHRIGCESATLA